MTSRAMSAYGPPAPAPAEARETDRNIHGVARVDIPQQPRICTLGVPKLGWLW
jgi:hypothetical protein